MKCFSVEGDGLCPERASVVSLRSLYSEEVLAYNSAIAALVPSRFPPNLFFDCDLYVQPGHNGFITGSVQTIRNAVADSLGDSLDALSLKFDGHIFDDDDNNFTGYLVTYLQDELDPTLKQFRLKSLAIENDIRNRIIGSRTLGNSGKDEQNIGTPKMCKEIRGLAVSISIESQLFVENTTHGDRAQSSHR
jgi:hypothetical protein